MNMTNAEISRLVKRHIQLNGMTLLECCDAFNAKYSLEIDECSTLPLNKDFLSRIVRNDFKVCTDRISKLCEFLEIKEARNSMDRLQVLSDQVSKFREQASEDKEFRKQFSAVEKFLSGLNLEKMFDDR